MTDPDAVAGEAQALRTGCLHRHPFQREVQGPRQRRAHLATSRRDGGTLAQDRDVARAGRVPGLAEDDKDAGQELEPADPFGCGIGIGEVLPDVAEGGRPEERIGDRVTNGVAVRVPGKSGLALEVDAAEPEGARGIVCVDVEPEAGADVSHASP